MSAVAASESNATNNFDTMMAAIKELQPVFRERAPQTRKERKVPQASIDALQDIGFFLALQPKRLTVNHVARALLAHCVGHNELTVT